MSDRYKDELRAAKGRVEAHRSLLLSNLSATKRRISPSELKRDVEFKVRKVGRSTRDAATDSVKNHPYAVSVGLVAVAAYLLRKPIAKAAPKVGGWVAEKAATAHQSMSGDATRTAAIKSKIRRMFGRGRP